RVGIDPSEEFRQRRALPGSDRAPSLDANVPRNLRDLGQSVQFVERPGLLVSDQTGDLQLVGLAVNDGRFVFVIVAVEREWPRDCALRVGGRKLGGTEQGRLHAIVELRNLAQYTFSGFAIDNVAASQKSQSPKARRAAQETAPACRGHQF